MRISLHYFIDGHANTSCYNKKQTVVNFSSVTAIHSSKCRMKMGAFKSIPQTLKKTDVWPPSILLCRLNYFIVAPPCGHVLPTQKQIATNSCFTKCPARQVFCNSWYVDFLRCICSNLLQMSWLLYLMYLCLTIFRVGLFSTKKQLSAIRTQKIGNVSSWVYVCCGIAHCQMV